jgi:hypothetical protein
VIFFWHEEPVIVISFRAETPRNRDSIPEKNKIYFSSLRLGIPLGLPMETEGFFLPG